MLVGSYYPKVWWQGDTSQALTEEWFHRDKTRHVWLQISFSVHRHLFRMGWNLPNQKGDHPGGGQEDTGRNFPRFELPNVIGSNNGPTFVSQVSQLVAKLLGIDLKLHCAYRPQSSGQVERMNRTIKEILTKLAMDIGTKDMGSTPSHGPLQGKKYSCMTWPHPNWDPLWRTSPCHFIFLILIFLLMLLPQPCRPTYTHFRLFRSRSGYP